MQSGLSFKQVMSAMTARQVRWPISRELAIRYHHLPKDALEMLEKRKLVRPGRLPKGVRLPPPTNDLRIDQFVRDLTIIGIEWPVTRDDIRFYQGAGPKTMRVLAEHGLIMGRELDEGSLTLSQIRALEYLEIESREEFRARIVEGDLDLRKCRNIGQQGVEKLMAWAFGNEVPPAKRGLNLRVSAETREGLETLRMHRGLPDHDQMVEELVAEALRAAGLGRQRRM